MNGNMNTRSMIFTIYGDYIRHYGNEIWIGSLIKLLQEFGHNDQSVRAAISRMGKQGWVTSSKRGNKSYYSLSEIGVARIEEAATRIFKLKPIDWDGKWRMLMYSIPEEKRSIRDELRQELVWSGFGMLLNSCWISPNNLETELKLLVKKYNIETYVHFFEAEYKGPGENDRIVNTCWDITDINKKYEEFIAQYSPKYVLDQNKIANGEMTDADCFVERTKLVHEYRKFLFIDPGLPDELLPDKWLGNHAAKLFGDYYKVLAQPASEFFERIFEKENELDKKDSEYEVLSHPYMID